VTEKALLNIHVKTVDSNQPLHGIRISLSGKKSHKTDDTGKAEFSGLGKGEVNLRLTHPDYDFDHLQYRGKSHHSTAVTLHAGERLEVLAFMRRKRRVVKKKLDQLISEYSSRTNHRSPKIVEDFREVMHLMESAFEHRGFERALMRLADVELQAEALEHELERLDHELGYREKSMLLVSEDPGQLAIQLQEYLGLPKFEHEHPNAALMWQQCLSMAHSLQGRIRARNESIHMLRSYLRQHQSPREAISSLANLLENGAIEGARQELRPISDRLLDLHARIHGARNQLMLIDSYSHMIDSPEKMNLVRNIIST
jgi:hypothetical protein